MTEIARPKFVSLLAIDRGKIFEQFDLVTAGGSEHGKLELGALHAGNLLDPLARLMRAMRVLEPKHVTPKAQRALEIRDCDAGVIGGKDAERHGRKRRTPNVQRPILNGR